MFQGQSDSCGDWHQMRLAGRGRVRDQAMWGHVAWFKCEGKPLGYLKKKCDPKNPYTFAIANISKITAL